MVEHVSRMVYQSVDVLQHPNEHTFERYERSGTVTHAAIYMSVAGLIAGIFGLAGGLGGFIGGIIGALLGFFLFTGLVYFIGKNLGGTGSFDEVAYTFSLFIAPLTVVGAVLGLIPVIGDILNLLLILVWGFFAYIAVRSSMNIRSGQQAFIVLGAAILANILIQVLIGIFLGGLAVLAA